MTSTLDTSQRNPLDESVRSVAQEGVKQKDLHEAWITLLDGRKLNVHVHKNADGEVLFNLVTNAIGLIEKDYFALAFYDQNIRKWLYTKKKVAKQVKELPWEFSLEVKFYTPDPRQLNEDFTRHLFTLQLRIDLYEGRLPATLLNQAHLGSLIAQAELGDYKPECQYYDALKGLNIVRSMSSELADKIIACYKEQKGKTPPEAELAFLLACREISMYGMAVFDAKERSKPVRIGINSSGISIFNDQLRVHYITWQSMHQLEFQRKTFTVRLKPGEKEGKTSLTFKLEDESSAKRCWKTAVEHHTFFRLVQPDEKNRRLLKFGSGQFRHEGRTLFQTQMASQMFDGTQMTTQQIPSAHLVTHTTETVTSHTELPSAPFHQQPDESGTQYSKRTGNQERSQRDTFSPQSTNGTEVGEPLFTPPAIQDQALSINAHASKPLFVTTTTLITSADPSVSSRFISESLSPQLIQLSPQYRSLKQETSELPTFDVQAVWQRRSMSPASFHPVPTLLTSAWFCKRHRSLTPRPQSITKIEPDSAQFTTTTKSNVRSATASPYTHSENGELFLPIVREMNQQTMTTLMSLPSRSHTVLAEYLSQADTSHLSPDLIAAYRNLLTAGGNTPTQAEEKIRAILNNRVYCRRSPLSPPDLNTPLPPDVEELIRTRSPSPTVRFDESVNHCIRIKILEVNNETQVYQYDVSAAEAHRAAARGGYSPNRQGYTSLTREDGNKHASELQETPKRSFFGQRKRPHPQPFVRAENTPLYLMRKDNELQEEPVRFYSNIYHSGQSAQRRVNRFRYVGEEETREVGTEEYSYLNGEKSYEPDERLEKEVELQPQNIRSTVNKRSSPQRTKRRRFTPSRPHFSTPKSVFHRRTQRLDPSDYKNGLAHIDLSPIPSDQPTTSYQQKEGSEGITELIVQTSDVDPDNTQVDIYSGPIVSRNRRYRFITRAKKWQQDEPDTRPTYKLDTSVFVGIPEELKRQIEVEQQPIRSLCSPYYKDPTTRKKKRAIRFGRKEEPGEESVGGSDEEEEEAPKQTAKITLKSEEHEPEKQEVSRSRFKFAKKEGRSKKTEMQKQPTLPTISEPYTGPVDSLEQRKEFDGASFEECVVVCAPSTSVEEVQKLRKESPEKTKTKHGLFGFLSKDDWLSHYPKSEPFEGPLEVVRKSNELEGDPLRRHVDTYHSGYSLLIHSRRYRFFTRERHEGNEEVVEKVDPSIYKLDSAPFEGKPEALERDSDVETQPIRTTCQIYHPGISYVRPKHKRAKHGREESESSGESEVVEELNAQKRASQQQITGVETITTTKTRTTMFKFSSKQKTAQMPEIGEPYSGELTALKPDNEFDSKLFEECVAICQPSTSGEKITGAAEESELPKSTAKLYLKKAKEVEVPAPKEKKAKKSRLPFARRQKEGYPTKTDPIETSDVISRYEDFSHAPLNEYAEVYHPGTSHDIKPSKSEPVVEELKQAEPEVGKTAKIHIRSIEVDENAEPQEVKQKHSLFGFAKRRKEAKPSLMPQGGEAYSGPLEQLDRSVDADLSPLEEHVSAIQTVQYPMIRVEEAEPQSTKTAKIFLRSTEPPETEELQEKKPKKSRFEFTSITKRLKSDTQKEAPVSAYPLTEPYTGELNTLARDPDHESSNISELIDFVYVETPSDKKSQKIKIIIEQPSEQSDDGHQKQAAVLHLRSADEESEQSEVPKGQKRSLFGFLRKSEKKHEEKVASPSTSSYPLPIAPDDSILYDTNKDPELEGSPLVEHVQTPEADLPSPTKAEDLHKKSGYPFDETPFDGELDSTKRNEEFEQLPILEHATVYHPGTSSKSKIPKISKKEKQVESEETTEKQTAVIHTTTTEFDVPADESTPSKSLFGYFKGKLHADEHLPSYQFSTEKYEGPLDLIAKDGLEEEPLDSHVKVYYDGPDSADAQKLKKRESHHEVKPESKGTGYPDKEDEYTGPLELLAPDSNVERLQINQFVDINAENQMLVEQYLIKLHRHKKPEKQTKQEAEEQRKLAAKIHVKSDEEPETEEQPETAKPKSLFGFLKSPRSKKPDEVLESPKSPDYPTTVLPSNFEHKPIKKDDELKTSPLDVPEPTLITRHKKYRLFMREKEDADKENLEKLSYPFDREAYQGPLEFIEPDEHIERVPITQIVNVYYDEKIHGKRRLKIPKIKLPEREAKPIEEPKSEEAKQKKTALIRLKEKPSQTDESRVEQTEKSKFWRKHRPERDEQQKTILSNAVYGLSSDPFAVSDELNRLKDFQSEPIQQHVDLKHPGFSTAKSKAPRAKPQEETVKIEELDPNKKTAVLHLRSIENIDENLSHTSAEPLDKQPAFFGFLRGRKGKKTELHSYPSTEPPYDGPLDSIGLDEELSEDPNIVVAESVAYPDAVAQKPKVQKEVETQEAPIQQEKKTAVIHLKHEEVAEPEIHEESKHPSFFGRLRAKKEKPETEASSYALNTTPYDGQLDSIQKEDEFVGDPTAVNFSAVSYPDESATTRKHQLNLFLRKKTESEEPTSKVSYNFDPTEYSGPLDSIENSEFNGVPLESTCEPTNVPLTEKSKFKLFGFGQKSTELKSSEEKAEEEEKPTEKSTAILHLRSPEEHEEERPRKSRFEFRRKDEAKKEARKQPLSNAVYGLSSSPFTATEELAKTPNLDIELIEQHVDVKYPGTSVASPKKPEESEKQEIVESLDKKTAIIHLKKGEEPTEPVPEFKQPAKAPSFFAFIRRKDQHTDESKQYPPQITYEGPLDTVKKDEELVEDPSFIVPETPKNAEHKIRGLHLFLRHKHEEPTVEVKRSAYDFDTTPFDGQHEEIKYEDFAQSPLSEHVEPTQFPIKEEEPELESVRTTKTAHITLRSEEEPSAEVSEKKRWSLIPQRKPTVSAYPTSEAYLGPLENVEKREEFETDPSFVVQQIAYPEPEVQPKLSKGLHIFTRSKEAESGKKSAYDFDTTPFDGDSDLLHYNALEQSPLSEHVEPTQFPIKEEEPELESVRTTKTAHITLRSEEEPSAEVSEKKRWSLIPQRKLTVSAYPTSEPYTGELDTIHKDSEFEADPSFVVQQIAYPEPATRPTKGLHLFLRQKPAIVEVKKSAYDFDTTPFEGEFDPLHYNALERSPLSEHVELPAEKAEPTSKKSKALITLRSEEESPVEVSEKKRWSLIPQRKTKESVYPTSEPYTGPLENIERREEFEVDPNFVVPEIPTESDAERQVKGLKIFLRRKHEEPTVEVKKSAYDFDPTPFDGQHDEIKHEALEQSPLSDHVEPTQFPVREEEPPVEVTEKKRWSLIPQRKTEKEAASSYPTSESYTGELDTTHKDNEFETDPNIIVSSDVPYPQPLSPQGKILRLFLRERHEGEEEVGEEKSKYGFDTTPFEGQHEQLKREDFEASPILDYVDAIVEQLPSPVESPESKSTAHITLRSEEESPVEVSEKKRWSLIPQRKTKESVYPTSESYTGPLENIERREEFEADPNFVVPEIPTESDAERKIKGLHLFLRQKPATVEVKKSAYDFDTTPFDGQHEEIKPEALEQLPLSEHVKLPPEIPIIRIEEAEPVTKKSKALITLKSTEKPPVEVKEVSERKRWTFVPKRKAKEAVSSYPTSEPYTGELDTTHKDSEFETDPNIIIPSDIKYPDAERQVKGLKIFLRQKPATVEVKKSAYDFDPTPFTGDFDPLHYNALEQSPLSEHVDVTVKEPTPESEAKSTAFITLKDKEQSPSEIKEKKRISWSFLPGQKQEVVSAYPTSEPYIGELDTTHKDNEFEADPNIIVSSDVAYPQPLSPQGKILRLFLHERHEGEEEVGEEKSKYNLDTAPFEGETDPLHYSALKQLPLSEHIEIKELSPTTEIPESKLTGLITLRDEQEPQIEATEKRTSWSFLPSRKVKEHVSAYPTSEPYTGELDTTHKDNEFEADPNIIIPSDIKYPKQTSPQGKILRLFLRERHEGEEEVGEEKSKYGFDTTPFEGQHEQLKREDFEDSPLTSHVEPTQLPTEKQTALLTLKSEEPTESEEVKRFSLLPKRKEKAEKNGYPVDAEPYTGELDTTHKDSEFEADPSFVVPEIAYPEPEVQPKLTKGLHIFTRGKDIKTTDKYGFDTTPFDGQHQQIKHDDFESVPLSEHVELRVKEPTPEVESIKTTKTAHIILKSTEEPPAEVAEKRKSWSFLPARKQKHVSAYPTSEPYTGELDTTHKDSEFEADPNFVVPSGVEYPDAERQVKSLKIFLRQKPATVEVIEAKKSAYDFDPAPFEGQHDEIKHEDFAQLPLSEHVEPTQLPPEKQTALLTLKSEKPVKVEEVKRFSLLPKHKEKTEAYSFDTTPFTGEFENIEKREEFEADPNFAVQQIVYPEPTETSKTGKGLHIFTRGKDTKTTDKYGFDTTPFDGQHEEIKHEDFESVPFSEHVEPTQFPVKEEEPELESVRTTKTAHITLRSEEESPVEVKEKRTSWSFLPSRKVKEHVSAYPTSEPYTGELENIEKREEFETDPSFVIQQVVYPEPATRPTKGLHIFTRSKEVESGKKSAYDFDTTPFDGQHDEIKHEDFAQSPLSEHVEPTQFPIKEEEPELESVRMTKTAHITLKSEEEPPAEVSEKKRWSLIPQRKPTVSAYPTSEPYTGPLENIEKREEFETDPSIIIPSDIKYPKQTSPQGKILRLFLRERHEGVEEVGEEKSKYGFDTTPFEGQHEEIKPEDFAQSPLSEHVEPTQLPPEKRTALLTLKSEEPTESEEVKRFSLLPKRKEKAEAYSFDTTPFTGEHEVIPKHQEFEADPDFVIQQVVYPEPTTRPTKGLHIFTRSKEVELTKKSAYDFDTAPFDGQHEEIKPEALEQLPLSEHVDLYHQTSPPLDIPTINKQTALIYVKSAAEKEQKLEPKPEAEPKPAKRAIWSVFRKRRRAASPTPLEPVALARKTYESELVGGMAIGNAALFKSGEPVTDLNIDLFLRKHETSQYHVELMVRDLRTTQYPVLFGGRRGPKFLPRSLFEESNDEAWMSLREPRTKRPKPDPSRQQPPDVEPEEGEEADKSSLASVEEEESTPKRHKLHHHRPHPHESSQATQSKTLADPKESSSLLSSFRQQIFQIGKKSGKSPAKEELKQRKHSSSSSDSQEVEIEQRHKVLHEQHDSSKRTPTERTTDKMFKTITNYANELSEGPYTSPNDAKHGQVIRHEKVDQVYRITGSGQLPTVDPTDPEANPPRTTLQSWTEKTTGPEQVTVEKDQFGNVIKKTIKTEQVKHTIQKQSYQTYTVDDDGNKSQSPSDLKQTLDSVQSISSSIPTNLPSGQARTHVLVYGKDGELREPLQGEQFDENQIVESKVVTTGNRTIETITYKNIKDGVVHTNVEHRVTIVGPEVDQDAELRRAIAEATGLNPKYEVQRIEIKEERLQ